ncbi:MAG TPA: ABC transporter permease [Candidatus Nitrosopolaris sp.]|nr:ABC transporter permease [Candidatus Nitrosopolaris sp.]
MRTRRRGTRAVRLGTAGLALLALAAIAAPLLTSAHPDVPALEERLRPPGPGHPLGQDALGRDVLARILQGARISLLVGAVTVGASVAAGLTLGAAAGYAGGWLDAVVMRSIDLLLAFPGLLLAIALAAVLGPSVRNVVLALSLLGWTGYARLVRAEVAALRRREFVHAAEALGARPCRIIARHLLPLVTPTLLVQATFGMAGAIVAESSLSFLGLGAPPPLASWGAMIDEGRGFLLVAPHLTVFPGIALAATVLTLQLLGDGLRDLLDVQERP